MIDSKTGLIDYANNHDQTVATVSVGMLISNRFHQIMMVERNNGDLQIPSGKLKPCEESRIGATRETLEETGQQINFSKPDQIIYTSNSNGLMSIGIIFAVTSALPENWSRSIAGDEDIITARMLCLDTIINAYENEKIFKPAMTMQALYSWIKWEYDSPFEGITTNFGSKPPAWLTQYTPHIL